MVEKEGFTRKEIPNLNYGVIHSQSGFSDGVSIVMSQIEEVLIHNLKISKTNIYYLVGNSGKKGEHVTEEEVMWDRNKANRSMLSSYKKGFGGRKNERFENAIRKAKDIIEKWVTKNKINVLIVHNSALPINAVYSIALSRYYRDSIKKRKKTPKYIMWWHDSHLERKFYLNPSRDIRNYLLEGVPGRFVEYIVFINKTQFQTASKYFKAIDKRYPGFYNHIKTSSDVAYNTADRFINSFRDLSKKDDRSEQFIKDFKIKDFLKRNKLKLKDTLFCLQHTRMINRKRIDFALKYCYKLLVTEKNRKHKAIYFLVSGQSMADTARKKLETYQKKLREKYPQEKLFLVFVEDYSNRTSLLFEEYPKIFAQLGGFSTYFSEVEGFGNNLLEVLASGLIPVIYKYEVFKTDIESYGFELQALDEYKIMEKDLEETFRVIDNKNLRRKMVEKNLRILKKHFPHKVMAVKLIKAITKKRLHI